MCGIVALVGLGGRRVDADALERMSFSLQHRGPDDTGVYIRDSVGFGFRRLSILDLSPAGHQPKISRDGKAILVFNGMIYNYVELRAELVALGHTFESTGDTEVLLSAYRQWGTDCVSKFNGMWAFLIYDVAEGKIFGSRDRFGEKPLYSYSTENLFVFASEIKAIVNSGYYQTKINWEVAARFFIEDRLDVDNQTFYAQIEQVPAGSAFELYLDGRYKKWSYWSLADISPAKVTSPCEAFKDLFEDAVRLRMRSDVPIGVCLSGGMDSTSIICSMARAKASSMPLEAFSYMANEYDESQYITDTINYTGARLNQLIVNPGLLLDKLQKILWHHDEPVHSMTALVGFELMGLASKTGVKVVLNGQGADETIGGYHSYFHVHWNRMLQRGEVSKAWDEHKQHATCLGLNPYMLFFNSVLSVLKIGVSNQPLYKRAAAWKYRMTLNSRRWFTSELLAHLKQEAPPRIVCLEDALKAAIRTEPLPLYLRIEDRNAMAHGIETRLPFLDHRLVTLLFNLSAEWKMKGPWNKYILRQSMAGSIPESVRTRPDKMGFPVPAKQWVAKALYDPFQDLLSSREMREAGLYNIETIRKDLEMQRNDGEDFSTPLFNIAQFQLWSKINHSVPAGRLS